MITVCVATVRETTIAHLVNSIRRQTFQDWELILVSQGQDPSLLEATAQMCRLDGRIRTIALTEYGRSRALNAAVAHAHGDIVAFTDDDCEATEDWLNVTDGYFCRYPNAGIVAGDVHPKDHGSLFSVCPATFTTEVFYQPSAHGYQGPPGYYWGGGNLAVRRDVFTSIGGFDPYMGPGTAFPAAEDVDFGLRSEMLDVAVATTPASLIYHTFGRRRGLQTCAKHLYNYALGQGALAAKLEMIGRPQVVAGGRRPSMKDSLRESYQGRIRAHAKREYLATYRLTPKFVSEPLTETTHR